jgi:hypothetical protein
MTKDNGRASACHDDQPAAAPVMMRQIPARMVAAMLAAAARAPSVHNTQPWRFAVGERAIDPYADPSRKLSQDRDGRQMLISCGAALFGLRLAVPCSSPDVGPGSWSWRIRDERPADVRRRSLAPGGLPERP